MAGIFVLPYTLGSAMVSVVASRYIFYTGRYKDMVVGGLGLSTLGFGELYSFIYDDLRVFELYSTTFPQG